MYINVNVLILMSKNRLQLLGMLEFIALIFILLQPSMSIISPVVEADPGTIYVPLNYGTIQEAIDNADEDDTIIVSPGTYKESIEIDKRLTVQGQDKSTTIIDGMGGGNAVWITADDVVFSDFTVINGSVNGINCYDGTFISDCIIYKNVWNGIWSSGDSGVSIVNCTIYGNDDDGVDISDSNDMRVENVISYNNKFGIRIQNTDDARILNCDTYDNSDDGIHLAHSDYAQIIDCDSYNNSDKGLYLGESNHARIENCDVWNSGNDGIYIWYSIYAQIEDSDSHHNGDEGFQIDYSDYAKMMGCKTYNNSDEGALIQYTKILCIKDFESCNNDLGTYLYYTHFVNICNSTYYNNRRGLYTYYTDIFYISRSVFHENSEAGVYPECSNGVLVNCNITDNGDDGIYADSSDVLMRYCDIHGNVDFGAYTWAVADIDAIECWWGSSSGPYQSSFNPTGTGDEVDLGVDYEPWQTELSQPEALVSDLRCCILRADENMVYYVPTGNIYDDSAFYAFYNYKENPQVITAPTQSPESSAYLDGDGSPLFDGDIVTFGGRFANRMVAHYEDTNAAIVGFLNNGTHRIFKRISDGSHLYAVDFSTYNETEKDYFVFQIYRDGDRHIFSVWGIRAPGTYAGGTCFIDIIHPNLHEYVKQYYVFSWTDSNNDDMPQQDEIALEASGS